MKKNKSVLIGIVSLVVLVGLVIGVYLYFKNEDSLIDNETSDLVDFKNNPKKGEPGYIEKDSVRSEDGSVVYKGGFEKVDGGKIFLKSADTVTELHLSLEEIAIQCSPEDLEKISGYDLHKIVGVKLMIPERIQSIIPRGTPVFLFASRLDESVVIHTVVVPQALCLKIID